MSATFEAIVAAGKLAVDAITSAVDRINMKKMIVVFEKKIHDQYTTINNVIAECNKEREKNKILQDKLNATISRFSVLEERLSARDIQIEELKAGNFELLRFKESHIKKES